MSSASSLLSHVFPDLPPGWWQWVSWGSALVLAHGITLELYLVGVVQQPVPVLPVGWRGE